MALPLQTIHILIDQLIDFKTTKQHYQTPNDVPGQYYYGRGYMQLSWQYNYLAASKDLYGDDRLARNPDQVKSSLLFVLAFGIIVLP